jgi:prepilin-type N-terminal cleavage/methylation domain-containing protein/prepilin-type processing-associated H-X9-DG protein
MKPARGWARGGFSLVELLVVIAIVAVLVALLIPAIQRARATAARVQCVNNLKQIGQALHNYHDVYGYFPTSSGDFDGWMYIILPYIEQDALYKQGRSPDPDIRASTWSTVVPLYVCSADPRENAGGVFVPSAKYPDPLSQHSYALTSYLGVMGQLNTADWDGVFGGITRISQITDGLSNTLLVGERPPSTDLYWGWWTSGVFNTSLWAIVEQPALYGGTLDSNGDGSGTPCSHRSFFSEGDLLDYCHVNHYWSFHPGGANWLLCDCSVRFMQYTTGTDVIPAMASMNGGEVIPSVE